MTDGVVFASVPEAARRSGVSKDYIYSLCHNGKIEFFQIGKKFMVNYPRMMEYLEAQARAGLQN